MLRLMRDYATSWMIKIILGAIVVVFVFWGVGSFRDRKANVIASVNGEAVTLEEYRSSYNTLLDQMRRQFGDNLNAELLQMMNLDRQALEQLIEKRLLMQAVEDLQLRVTDEEVIQDIQRMSAFHTNGIFDSRLYTTVLNFNRLTPEGFEAAQKERMLIEKLRNYLVNDIKVSENELREYYDWKNTTVAIDYAVFDPETYQVELTDEAIETYFNDNRETYRTEPQRKAQYLVFDPQNYKDGIQISAEDIENYYVDNKDKFSSPKTVEARHILIKVDSGASEEDIEKAKVKAEEVLALVKKGEDFAEMAKKHSEGPSAANGGHLGTFKKEDMVAPFSEKAFSMQAGEVSEPVRTQFGWHLIKVEKVNAASVETLEEATNTIQATLIDDEARVQAYDKAESFFESTLEGDNIAVVGSEMGYEVHTTELFAQDGPEKGIKNPGAFGEAAFALAVNQISDVQDFNDGYYILQIIEDIPGTIPSLESVKETVIEDLTRVEQAALAQTKATHFLSSLSSDGTSDDKNSETSIELKSTEFFKRSQQIPEIGFENEISQAAFTLSSANPLPETILKGRKGFYVIRYKDRRLPDPQGFDKEKDQLSDTLINQKQIRAFNTWLSELRKKSEISVHESFEQ